MWHGENDDNPPSPVCPSFLFNDEGAFSAGIKERTYKLISKLSLLLFRARIQYALPSFACPGSSSLALQRVAQNLGDALASGKNRQTNRASPMGRAPLDSSESVPRRGSMDLLSLANLGLLSGVKTPLFQYLL
jgi:hypothetical protein